ncbi:MAG: precorrin-8X methylmutase [Desulfurivibrionaceae bacterium]
MSEIKKISPEEIEPESFRIIAEELGPTSFDSRTFKVVQRVIHATGDFSFAETMRFHPRALDAGIEAVRNGQDILVDVAMGASGISTGLLNRWGGEVLCRVSDPAVRDLAAEKGQTRSESAMELGLTENTGIVVVGNAPTALLKIMDMIPALGSEQRPRLIVGVPVGFVNAAEAKELLLQKDYPYITCTGRKGGSGVAAAIVNALIRLAGEE